MSKPRKNRTIELVLVFVLLGLSLIPVAIHSAHAAVAASGFAVTNFATGFFASGYCCGPIGVAFDPSGNLFVMDAGNGFLYKFGSAGGLASPTTQVNAAPITGFPLGLAFTPGGHLYLARQTPGDLLELDTSTGAIIRTVDSICGASGIALDPLSGDLFVSGGPCANTIFRVSNFASGPGTVTAYASVTVPDGLAFGPDGTLYAASFGSGVVKVSGTNSATPGVATFIASVPSSDGMAVSANPSRRVLFGNRNDGIITEVNFTTATPTLTNIITGGSRGDFATVGSDGCLYATQTDSVLKVTNADGSCLPPPLGPLFPSNPPSTLKVSKFLTDSSLNPLPLDSKGNPKVDVVLAGGVVKSTNPGQVLAWVNVTNTDGSLQSLKLNETLPKDWVISPPWMPAKGAIHVFFANTTSLATNPEITQPSTITVSGPSPRQTVHVAIPSFNATAIGHPLLKNQSILLEVKLDYGLDGTMQSASTYPRNYTDTANAKAWTMPSYRGIAAGPSAGKGLFTAYAKVVGDVDGNGSVDITDLVLVWQHQFTNDPRYDVNGNGVDLSDLVITCQSQFR